MEKLGFFKISDLLKKPSNDLTDLESSLINAIHWFNNSQEQDEVKNELLSLIICLEILLKPKSDEKISSVIREGLAIILIDCIDNENSPKQIEKCIEMREKYRDVIKDFYNARSTIVHGSRKYKKAKKCLENISELRDIVKYFILKIIERKDEFEDKGSLSNWIEYQKFSKI